MASEEPYETLEYIGLEMDFSHEFTFRLLSSPLSYSFEPVPITFDDIPLMSLWETPEVLTAPRIQTTTGKSDSKGSRLKLLGPKVQSIVKKLSRSTYKLIGDEILKELAISSKPDYLKCEKNVRRRVYDAINVLIAVGLLKKERKWITPLPKHCNENSSKRSLESKRERLRELYNKYVALQGLYERNRVRHNVPGAIPYPFSIIALAPKSIYEVKSM